MTTATKAWSPYQEAVFRFMAADGAGNGAVFAVAGSGKTSTIEEGIRRMPSSQRVRYLVFNKRNADEAQRRMPPNCTPSTFHAAAMRAIVRAGHRATIDDQKSRAMLRAWRAASRISDLEERKLGPKAARLAGLGKNAGIGLLSPNDRPTWERLIDHYGFDWELKADDWRGYVDPRANEDEIAIGVPMAEFRGLCLASALVREAPKTNTRDFDDMLYDAVRLGVSFEPVDMVVIDEAQDTNAIQRALLVQMLASSPGARLIAVGDPGQAIYGFRGADAGAMRLLSDQFACQPLRLSVNYRCARAVIEEAREIVPEISAHDAAPAGSVEWEEQPTLDAFTPGDAVLCRTNAPLVRLALRLLASRTPATILGRDIGRSLVALVDQLATTPGQGLDAFEDALKAHRDAEIAKLAKKGKDAQAEALEDRCACVLAVIDSLAPHEATVPGLREAITALFSDAEEYGAVTLASVHRSKGLEWPTVWILNRDQMPHPRARLPWEREQEQNLIYVATTRAKVDLRLVTKAALEKMLG